MVFLLSEHPEMMLEDFLRKTFQDPRMLQSLKRSESVDRVPVYASSNEVEEVLVLALEHSLQSLSIWPSLLASAVCHNNRRAIVVEEETLPC